MLRYIARRLLEVIPTTFGILVLTFVLFHVVGGSPALSVLGKNATKESIAAFNHRYGYDKPLLWNLEKGAPLYDSQFCHFVGNLAKGDFGVSTQYDEPVADILKRGPRSRSPCRSSSAARSSRSRSRSSARPSAAARSTGRCSSARPC